MDITKLDDKRIPTCPHCGMAKLEVEDTIDIWTNIDVNELTELNTGVCPNCNHCFEYKQIFTYVPIKYEILEDVTEDEED